MFIYFSRLKIVMYITRDLEKKFELFINDREILAVIGPRQAGKTTFINRYLDNMSTKKINRISFEDKRISRIFEENIEAFIEEYVRGYEVVFIDEVQYVKESGQKLKFIYDMYDIKLIISGSSATELSINSIKYLVGRIIVFELQTLSFDEFLRFKDMKLFSIYSKKLFSQEVYTKLYSYLQEYMLFGGYPRVVSEKNKSKKIELLKNIYNSYLLKEVLEILQYRESRIIQITMEYLASQISGIINYDELSSKIGISVYEVKNVLSILEKTFICSFSRNFHTNKQTELVKSPKVFFYDLGLRNYILDIFKEIQIDGKLIENMIATQLLRVEIPLKYWRTKSGAEVDFIVEKSGELFPIEIKTYCNKDVVEKSLRSFITKYAPKNAYLVSKNFTSKRTIEHTIVNFISFYELFLKLNEITN